MARTTPQAWQERKGNRVATKAQKVKVGIFVIVHGILITVCLLLVAGYRSGTEEHFTVIFENSVLGLYVGGMVQYLGVPVGTVDNIYVGQDGKAYVDVLIDPDSVTLYEGVEAKLEFYSFATGTMCVALSGGDPTSPELPEGSIIPAGESLVESFSNQFAEVLESLNGIVEQLRTGLDGIEAGELTETIRQAKEFIEDSQGFVKEARDTVKTLSDDVHGTVDNVNEGIEQFNNLAESATKMADTANEAIKTFQAKVEPLDLAKSEEAWRAKFEEVADRFDQTSKSFEETAQMVMYGTDNLQHGLLDTMQALNEALEAIRDLALYLQQDPAAVIRGKANVRGDE